jgi:hypothetical protein
MLSERMAELIEEGFDVAVRVEEVPDSSLIARQLAPCRMVVCGSSSYIDKHGRPRTPSDLTNHNCLTVAGTRLSYYRTWHLTAADGTALNISPMGNLRTNSGAVLMVAALAGHGLVCLPTYLVSDALKSRRLVTVLDDYVAPPYTLRALYPHNRHLSAKVRAFVDFLATRFGREPPWDSWCRTPSGQSPLPAAHQREMTGSSIKPRRSKTVRTLHDLALRIGRDGCASVGQGSPEEGARSESGGRRQHAHPVERCAVGLVRL